MNDISSSIIIMLLNILSSFIGAVLPFLVKIRTKKYIASLYEITSGMMIGVVCFSMIPESIEISNLLLCILGIILGTTCVLCIEIVIMYIDRRENKLQSRKILLIMAMAFHNIIEGLAIGVSMKHSVALGMSVLISMFLHDIPEGMLVGIASIEKPNHLMKNSMFVGISSGIGVYLGQIFGKISNVGIGISLAISAGAMLYIVSSDLLPESKTMVKSRVTSIVFLIGILMAVIISKQ